MCVLQRGDRSRHGSGRGLTLVMQHRRYSFVPSALAAALLDTAVTVGSRVRLTEQTGDDKTRRVTVKIEG